MFDGTLTPGGMYSMQGQSTMQFSSATHVLQMGHPQQQLTGGTTLSMYAGVFFRAGETAVFTCWASGEGYGNARGYTYQLCPDVDSNGTCDDYDRAARAFGDFDSSGSINGADLAALLAAWGPCTGPCEADLDTDGSVSGSDLAILLSRWGQGAP
jgi:hypothetical protein